MSLIRRDTMVLLIILWALLAVLNAIIGLTWWIFGGLAVVISLFAVLAIYEDVSLQEIFKRKEGGKDA